MPQMPARMTRRRASCGAGLGMGDRVRERWRLGEGGFDVRVAASIGGER